MPRLGAVGISIVRVVGLAVVCASLGCASVNGSAAVPPAPILLRWPDPAFLPDRQCRGAYAVDDLQRYLPRARVAFWLPGTRSVDLDQARRCITLIVESVGGGRLAELVMRGVAVPRGAVLLTLATSR
jgi:hypothetical protein